ncbi:UNVERIFIED_CONTAM: hypothetical protein RKD43_005538 [Streptomyces graminofaciens]
MKVAFDEQARWLAFRRGDLRVAVNLAKETAAIPLGGGGRIAAAWGDVVPPDEDGVLHLPAQSCAVLADS